MTCIAQPSFFQPKHNADYPLWQPRDMQFHLFGLIEIGCDWRSNTTSHQVLLRQRFCQKQKFNTNFYQLNDMPCISSQRMLLTWFIASLLTVKGKKSLPFDVTDIKYIDKFSHLLCLTYTLHLYVHLTWFKY